MRIGECGRERAMLKGGVSNIAPLPQKGAARMGHPMRIGEGDLGAMLKKENRRGFCDENDVFSLGVWSKNAGCWIKWGDKNDCMIKADPTSIGIRKERVLNT
jgi:hypothetical protein